MNMEKNALVKYTFLKLLLREFGIYVRETEVEKADLAKQCVEIYEKINNVIPTAIQRIKLVILILIPI